MPTTSMRDDRGLTLQGAMAQAHRCLLCHDAPCSEACPAGTDPGRFMRQLRFGNLAGAAETVLDNNPFGGVCGAVCPVSKLCEQACCRCGVEQPIRIGGVQNFLHRYGVEQRLTGPPVAEPAGKKVAIIGAGPAGLAAARELARRGATVTVFESQPKAGGTLRYGIAPMRLGDALIDEEVDRIAALGVEILCGTPVADKQASALLDEGFDAVLFATGLQRGGRVPMEGSDLPQVLTALEFLAAANVDGPAGRAHELVHDRDVVVVGGGSVAMDAANTARELGAGRVYAISLEGLDELPADDDEIALAHRYHVIFNPQTRVSRIVAADGAVAAVETIEIDWKEPGSLVPANAVDRPGTEGRLTAQAVIFAVGQGFDDSAAGLSDGLDKSPAGWVAVDDETGQTSAQRVYAGGDAARGGATVVQAVADGKRAAQAIMPGVQAAPRPATPSLELEFCGIRFPNPFCLSSSPVTNSAEMCARAFDAGWGGIYYKTLGQEQKFKVYHPSPRLNAVHFEGVRTVGLQNVEQITDRPLADNLADIEKLRKDYPDQVVCVSIMGFSLDDWGLLARMGEESGAQLLELNFSCPQMAAEGAGHKVGQVDELIEQFTADAKGACSIPVIAKMTPNITDMVPPALAAQRGGADGVSAINTLKSISRLDLSLQAPMPTIEGRSSISGFSGQAVRPIALRFIAEMAKSPELTIPISGMGGIVTWMDALEFLLLGSSNIQATTSVMRFGYRIVEDWADGLRRYMRQHDVSQVSQLVGAALGRLVDPAELSHQTEAVSRIDHDKCVGCGQCYIACQDGAHQAIHMEDRKPVVDEEHCVGCLMCRHLCPVDDCISYTTRTRAEFA